MKDDKQKPSSAKATEGKEEEKSSFAKATEDKEEKPKTEDLQKQLEEYQKLKEEYLNGWKRERADFLNYKKEEMERIVDLIKYANEELLLKMLPILDNFDVAAKNIPENLKNDENIKGLLQIKQHLKDFLKSQGIEEIKTVGVPPSPGATARQRKFDPNFMEAVEEIKREGVEPGVVIEETQKGYTLHGKVIRPAKVKVYK